MWLYSDCIIAQIEAFLLYIGGERVWVGGCGSVCVGGERVWGGVDGYGAVVGTCGLG